MHGPSLAATLAVALWIGLNPPQVHATTPAEAIARARALIAKDDPKAAAALLQDALPEAGADLGPMIVVLRQAYSKAADQAAKAGRGNEAEEYRENLQILNRKMRGGSPEAKGPSQRTLPPGGEGTTAGQPAHDVSKRTPIPRPDPPRPDPMPVLPRFEAPAPPEPLASFEEPKPPTPVPTSSAPTDPLAIGGPATETSPHRPLSRSGGVPAEAGRTQAGSGGTSLSQAPTAQRRASTPRPVEFPRDPAVAKTAAPSSIEPPARGPGVSAADVGGAEATDRGPVEPFPASPKPGLRNEPLAARVPPLEEVEKPSTPPRERPRAQPVASNERRAPAEGESPVVGDRRPSPTPDPAGLLNAADMAYLKGLYLDANVHYSALAKAGRLPDDRKPHWAYCRSADVLRRIKAKPATKEEWTEIHREIAAIKTLYPKYWYAEYLRNLATEEAKTAVKPPKGRVVRGAMPEPEDSATSRTRDLARLAPTDGPPPPVGRFGRPGAFAMAVPSTDTPPVVTSQGDSGRWKLRESANFVIFHDDPALADRVAEAAEAARDAVTRRWTGSPPPRPWGPKCEVYLYPTAAIFTQITGQPSDSPGFSTMESNGAAVTGRRIKLRADAPGLVEAVVPHEVTHVLLADLFPARQIPRWADEGISVLSEPATEQEKRVGDLDAALNGGRIFSVEALMVNDYPEGKYWPLYYAQSVSLTKFLVVQGKPGQFIDFLQGTQRNGIEPELKRVYAFEGYADLQSRWLAYAKESSAARVAARNGETRTR